MKIRSSPRCCSCRRLGLDCLVDCNRRSPPSGSGAPASPPWPRSWVLAPANDLAQPCFSFAESAGLRLVSEPPSHSPPGNEGCAVEQELRAWAAQSGRPGSESRSCIRFLSVTYRPLCASPVWRPSDSLWGSPQLDDLAQPWAVATSGSPVSDPNISSGRELYSVLLQIVEFGGS